AHQAEIDAACEVIDFWRFNVGFMVRIYEEQPVSSPGVWNRMEYRPLEGFVFAISPFNFTAIGANLSTSPALMGDVILWKPASTAAYSSYWTLKLLEEAGLPPGVINFLPGSGAAVGDPVLASDHLAGAPRAAGRGGRHHQDGRRQRLLELHGRRDRRQVVRAPEGGDRPRALERRGGARRRRHRRQRGLLRRADRDRDEEPARPADARGVLRPDRHHVRLPRERMGADPGTRRRPRAL